MKKIFVIILLVFLIGCAKNPENFQRVYIDNGKNLIKVNAEIADDNNERMKGLMFREKLNENGGMLFIFDEERQLSFWMKNTLMPLDMIFIGGNSEIVDIKHAVPCRQDPCETYDSAKPAKYVLEVNAGFATKNNIQVGDKIILEN